MKEKTEILDFLPEFANSERIREFYDGWPTFHDAEVIEIMLNRELGYDFSGPKLQMVLFVFSDLKKGQPKTRQTTKITLLFENVELNYLEDFNHQNAMADFMMTKGYSEQYRQDRYEIQFGEIGAKIKFTCLKISVLSIEPHEPEDYFKEQ